MKFLEVPLRGAFVIDLEPSIDERGSFARIACEREFAERGIAARFVQASLSCNLRLGTLRGLHFQAKPNEEAKLVRCTRGSAFDVIVDIRPESPTHLHWFGVEISRASGRAVYVPKGFAHGFQTLEDDTDLLYFMSEFFVPESASGLHWADPRIAIEWPLPDPILSPQDRSRPFLT